MWKNVRFLELKDRCFRIARDCVDTHADHVMAICGNWVLNRATSDSVLGESEPPSWLFVKIFPAIMLKSVVFKIVTNLCSVGS